MPPWIQALVPESSTHNHEPLREAAPPTKKKKTKNELQLESKGTLWLTPVTLTIGKQKQEDDLGLGLCDDETLY